MFRRVVPALGCVLAAAVVVGVLPATSVFGSPRDVAAAATRVPAPTAPSAVLMPPTRDQLSWVYEAPEAASRFEVRASVGEATQVFTVPFSPSSVQSFSFPGPVAGSAAVRSVVVRDGVERFSRWVGSKVNWGLEVSNVEASTAANQTAVFASATSPQLRVEFFKDGSVPALTRVVTPKLGQASVTASGVYTRVSVTAFNRTANTSGESLSTPVASSPVSSLVVDELGADSVKLSWVMSKAIADVSVTRSGPDGQVEVPASRTGLVDVGVSAGVEYVYTVNATWGSRKLPVAPSSITVRTTSNDQPSWVLEPGTVTIPADHPQDAIAVTYEQYPQGVTRVSLPYASSYLVGSAVLVSAGGGVLPDGLAGRVVAVDSRFIDVVSVDPSGLVARLVAEVATPVYDPGVLPSTDPNYVPVSSSVCDAVSDPAAGKLSVQFRKVTARYTVDWGGPDGDKVGMEMFSDVSLAGTATTGPVRVECALPLVKAKKNFMAGPVPMSLSFSAMLGVNLDVTAATPWSRETRMGFAGMAGSGENARFIKDGLSDQVQAGVALDGQMFAEARLRVGAGVDMLGPLKHRVGAGLTTALQFGYKFDTHFEDEVAEQFFPDQVRTCVTGTPFFRVLNNVDFSIPGFEAQTPDFELAEYTLGTRDRYCSTPQEVAPLQDPSTWQVSTGPSHACGVTPAGEVFCWGENEFGQLGDGTTQPSRTPVAVLGLGPVAQVSVGPHFSCAVTKTRELLCWGRNDSGQLGNGTFKLSATPVPVAWAGPVDKVEVGPGAVCAVADGQASCATFTRTTATPTTPRVTRLPVASVSRVLFSQELTCAQDVWGKLSCFDDALRRVTPPGLGSVSSFGVGSSHVCAVTGTATGRKVVCWGGNEFGQLGDGTTFTRAAPAATLPIPNPVSVNVSGNLSCARTAVGDEYCWGENPYWVYNLYADTPHELVPFSSTPILVRSASGSATSLGGSQVCGVDGSGAVSCASGSTTSVVTGPGGSPLPTPTPTPVPTPSPTPSVDPTPAPTPSDATPAPVALPGMPGSLNVQTRDKTLFATWTASTNTPTQYRVYYSTDEQNWTLFESNPASDRNSLITQLTNGQSYWVRVVAVNASGPSAPAVFGPVTPAPVPAVPANVSVRVQGPAAVVSWDPTVFATRYIVRWRLSGTSTYSTPMYTNDTSFHIVGLEPGKQYDVVVIANNTTGSSGSKVVSGFLMIAPPPAPVVRDLAVSLDRVDEYGPVTKVTFRVEAVSETRAPVTAVQMSFHPNADTDPEAWWFPLSEDGSGYNVDFESASPTGSTQTVWVRAVNAAGPGPATPVQFTAY